MITKTKQKATVSVALSLPGMIRCNHKIKRSWRTFGTAAKKKIEYFRKRTFFDADFICSAHRGHNVINLQCSFYVRFYFTDKCCLMLAGNLISA